jgi:hypothetical protein
VARSNEHHPRSLISSCSNNASSPSYRLPRHIRAKKEIEVSSIVLKPQHRAWITRRAKAAAKGDPSVVSAADGKPSAVVSGNARKPGRRSAHSVLDEHFPFKCCVVCGMTYALTAAHFDHDKTNNAPDNLARLCWTHHWMLDMELYSVEAIRLQQAHWQATKGIGNRKRCMKDAGAKAAATRKRNSMQKAGKGQTDGLSTDATFG